MTVLLKPEAKIRSRSRVNYFLTQPVGHFGLVAVTFLVIAPFLQVIVFLACVTFGFAGEVETTFGVVGLVVTKVTKELPHTSVAPRFFAAQRVIG